MSAARSPKAAWKETRPTSAREKVKTSLKTDKLQLTPSKLKTRSNASTASSLSFFNKKTVATSKENGKQKIQEESQEKKTKKSPVSILAPRNLPEEQQKFFESGFTYNPQFKYKDPDAIPDILAQYQPPQERYVQNALYILNKAVGYYGGGEQTQTEIDGGRLMTYEETVFYFNEYLLNLRIEHLVSLKFSEKAVARTSCKYNPQTGKFTITISLPIQYRINQINGVMNHEVGTHFLRKFNDKKQIWYKARSKWNLKNHLDHEEGLASINQQLDFAWDPKRMPFLWVPALHYYTAYLASKGSFVDTFKGLEPFIEDPVKRFRQALRGKRGLTDTSQIGGFYKDQVYLTGGLEILQNRKNLNFFCMYGGKMNLHDSTRMEIQALMRLDKCVFPYFFQDMDLYQLGLDRIAEVNGISTAYKDQSEKE